MESLRVLDALEAQETRLTVLMFAADDTTATASLAKTYRALGDRADYLLVKNPARFRSQSFDDSALAHNPSGNCHGQRRKEKIPDLHRSE
jgi:hypothetical protein